jgi:hypothetical protein
MTIFTLLIETGRYNIGLTCVCLSPCFRISNNPNDKHVTLHEYHNASNFKLHRSTQDLHDSGVWSRQWGQIIFVVNKDAYNDSNLKHRISFRYCTPPYVRIDMKLYCINYISTEVVTWLVAFVEKKKKTLQLTELMQFPFINTKSCEVRLARNAHGNTRFTTKIPGHYNIYD